MVCTFVSCLGLNHCPEKGWGNWCSHLSSFLFICSRPGVIIFSNLSHSWWLGHPYYYQWIIILLSKKWFVILVVTMLNLLINLGRINMVIWKFKTIACMHFCVPGFSSVWLLYVLIWLLWRYLFPLPSLQNSRSIPPWCFCIYSCWSRFWIGPWYLPCDRVRIFSWDLLLFTCSVNWVLECYLLRGSFSCHPCPCVYVALNREQSVSGPWVLYL